MKYLSTQDFITQATFLFLGIHYKKQKVKKPIFLLSKQET